MLQAYFAEKYGNYQFPIELVNDHFRCWIPGKLEEADLEELRKRRDGEA